MFFIINSKISKKLFYKLLRIFGRLSIIRFGLRDRVIRAFANPETIENFKFIIYDYNGSIFEGNLNSYVDWYIYFYGGLEKPILKDICIPILKNSKSPTFIDIGANNGNHTIYLAKNCSKVITYEPNKKVFLQLKKQIKLNNFKEVTLKNVALGKSKEKLPFYSYGNSNSGSCGFIKNKYPNIKVEGELQIINGDLSITKENLANIDLIKIDVEGFETNVLEGIKNTIKIFKPFIILEISNINKDGIKNLNDLKTFFPTDYIFRKISFNRSKLLFLNDPSCILEKVKKENIIGEIICIPQKKLNVLPRFIY